ncbi:MAG: lytic murein transglycosylase [Gammaproteobacteria bacterium]|nr:lytic murein transglycosylase [Gammaproteobacteria bacterium]
MHYRPLIIALISTGLLAGMAYAADSPPIAVDKNATSTDADASKATQSPTYEGWLAALKKEALQKKISEATLTAALDSAVLIPRVIELDRNQPEFKLTFQEYYARVASTDRVNKARELMVEHRQLLADIEKKYGVQPQYIVALWGMETDFGRLKGNFKVIDALVTLAYDGRRSSFFRRELIEALRIIDAGHIDAANMIGSWAGAMGQTQFMPSTFTGHAVDFDGNGKINVWDSTADALASGAHYLSDSGWSHDEPWGREVRLPEKFDPIQLGFGVKKTTDEWIELGVTRLNGNALDKNALRGSLVEIDGDNKRYFLVYDNYRAVMKWNRSVLFATTAGLLGDAIAGKTED